MNLSNPYAPPAAEVQDVVDPGAPLTPADRGTRLAAAILDGILVVAMVYIPIVLAFGISAGRAAATGAALGGDFTALLVGTFAVAGFTVWCMITVRCVTENGQSIAKRILGIKVVRTDGTPATLGRIFWLRNVVNWAFGLVPFYTIVDCLFIFSASRQCLHDRLADTIVVRA